MNNREELAARAANDLGGLEPKPFVQSDHELLPWEKRTHALLDVLNKHKLVNTEEKRRGVDELGRDIYAELSYYEKWILSACNILLTKGFITSEELAHKLEATQAREQQ